MALRLSSRRLLSTVGVATVSVVLTACGGGSLGGDEGTTDSGGGGEGGGTVRVGLVIPQAGVYTPIGEDMQQGWDLYLDQHDGKLGDYEVETVVADEGENPDTGVPAVQRLLTEDVDALVGIVNSATALGVAEQVTEAEVPLIVANAGAGAITADASSPYVWRTSFTNAQVSAAMGTHLGEEGVGPVYVMAPDYAAGQEHANGFIEAYEAAGGTVAGKAFTPFGTTQDFQPFLSGVQSSGAEATFVFYAGGEAVSFVQQYAQFGLKDSIPLYGAGFLTEGSVLDAQGEAAVGVQTTLHYSTEIDNEANQAFVKAYQAAYDELPTVYAVQAYDAANVLARALADAEDVSGPAITDALDGLGEIDDSPRGPWSFNGQTPEQSIYLREVADEGGTLLNTVVEDLGVKPQP